MSIQYLSLCAFILAHLSSCGALRDSSDSPKPGSQAYENGGIFKLATRDASKHGVMVIDSNFDVKNRIFENKIVGTYTFSCAETSENLLKLTGPYSDQKAAFLKNLEAEDRACTLNEGAILSESSKFDDILRYREAWNSVIRLKKTRLKDHTDEEELVLEQYYRINGILTDKAYSYYHGTATAGLISYKNPKVQLVLVQRPLSIQAKTEQTLECISEDERDRMVNLLTDPEIQGAYVHRPLSNYERSIKELAEKYSISIKSESFGSLSRGAYENALQIRGCPKVDLSSYFAAKTWLLEQRELWLNEYQFSDRPLLTVKAAGNSGDKIDTPKDSLSCLSVNSTQILVGASDHWNRKANFTNEGPCIDIYAPGTNITVSAPHDFLKIASGTSFSAPIVARFLTLTFPPSMPAGEMKRQIQSGVTQEKTLKYEQIPRELFNEEFTLAIDAYKGLLPTADQFFIANSKPFFIN